MAAPNVDPPRPGPGPGPETAPAGRPRPRRSSWWRGLPLLILAGGLVLFFTFGLEHDFTLAALREHRDLLMTFAARHAVTAPLAFIVLYLAVTAFCIPFATLLSLVGGFLFGPVAGTLWVVLGATGGATLVFLAARSALADFVRKRAGRRIKALEAGFANNALSYMLFLRLTPLFPFWLVNLAPALIGVPLRTFVLGTLIGITPGAFVYVFLGSGIGSILDQPAGSGMVHLVTPEIVAALVLLGLLALLPVGLRVWRRSRGRGEGRRD